MTGDWQRILNRYGQAVTVYRSLYHEGVQTRAFLQPVLERQQQREPTPLGVQRQDRMIYLGAADIALTDCGWVEQGRERYAVEAAHLVGGADGGHWWALLRPTGEDAT